jgi:hypothetical protein
MSYATRDELFLLALGAPAFVAYARPFDAVDNATATIRLKGHGFAATDTITFERSDGGVLPTGISEFVPYYPIPVTSDLFRVATTAGGAPIASWAISGDGWGIAVDSGRRLDAHLEEASAFVDEHLTAHDPPIDVDPVTGKYPPILIGITARIAARKAIASLEVENPQFRVAIDRLLASEPADQVILLDWKNGKPIQPRPTDGTSTADNSARASSGRAAMGWGTGML